MRPHRRQLTGLPRPWDSPGKNTGVGCHFLLQCMKVKSESEVAQSCLTPSDPMDRSPPGSSVHGIFQARVLEWGAIAFSRTIVCVNYIWDISLTSSKIFWLLFSQILTSVPLHYLENVENFCCLFHSHFLILWLAFNLRAILTWRLKISCTNHKICDLLCPKRKGYRKRWYHLWGESVQLQKISLCASFLLCSFVPRQLCSQLCFSPVYLCHEDIWFSFMYLYVSFISNRKH